MFRIMKIRDRRGDRRDRRNGRLMTDRRLDGRRAVVTGVASGLGREIARTFAAQGADVIGCDVQDAAGEETMAGIGRYRHADVARESDVQALVDDTVQELGGLDVFVNNAAIEIDVELLDTTEAQLDQILAVNLKGVFFGCKHAVRAMKDGGGGAIVNVASILALVGDGMLPAYCAAKGGVLALTRAVAVAYGSSGVRCNAICPGDIDTAMLQQVFAAADDPEALRAQISGAYPLQRISQPEEMARAVVFLASEDSSFMSGQPLVVDGGLLAKCY
jgi:NAD(P)-dependent dehydrogenase (short-subunit alcohol dehydrogenase family)